MIRITFPEIRPKFAPQSARLRPARVVRGGFVFLTSNQILRRPVGRRWKVLFMSPDLNKYRRIAEQEGEAHLYTDGRLLRLWACLETLLPRILTQTCPQFLNQPTASLPTQAAAEDVTSKPKEDCP
jgi:hypothetical protein